jgi:hypothetical protein
MYSNGDNRWNILGFNFTKRDVLSSVYKISMVRINSVKNVITLHSFHNYVICPGSLVLTNREPITLRNLLTRARFQDRKVCVAVLSKGCIVVEINSLG